MTTKFKSKAEQTEWIKISDDVGDSENAAVDAFAALAAFDDTAPKNGGQKAYDKWRVKNNDERSVLEYAALAAARAFVEAHDAMTDLFDREGRRAVGRIFQRKEI